MNDPQFSVVSIIWQAILNLLGKALTAPLSMCAGAADTDTVSERDEARKAELEGHLQAGRRSELLRAAPA